MNELFVRTLIDPEIQKKVMAKCRYSKDVLLTELVNCKEVYAMLCHVKLCKGKAQLEAKLEALASHSTGNWSQFNANNDDVDGWSL